MAKNIPIPQSFQEKLVLGSVRKSVSKKKQLKQGGKKKTKGPNTTHGKGEGQTNEIKQILLDRKKNPQKLVRKNLWQAKPPIKGKEFWSFHLFLMCFCWFWLLLLLFFFK